MDHTNPALLEVDLPWALDQLVLAIFEIVPANSDVIDPPALVQRWLTRLTPPHRAQLLELMRSERWAQHLGAVRRAVLTDETSWPTPVRD